MADAFASLKKNRNSLKDKILKETDKLKSGGHEADSRIWKPTADSAGNGTATIRFLAPPEGEDVPFVRVFEHGFKGPGGWLFENCPTSIKGDCAVCDHNSEVWATEDKSKQQWIRDNSKRKLNYYANILVVSDPANSANNGKVFLYKFGQSIFDKINGQLNPKFEDQDALNPFDMWEGANLRLRMRDDIKGTAKFRTYADSQFDTPTAVADEDEDIKAFWDQCYSLQAFIDPSQYKSYDDLQKEVVRAFKLNEDSSTGEKVTMDDEPKEQVEPSLKEKVSREAPSLDVDEDDDLKSFAALMNEDD